MFLIVEMASSHTAERDYILGVLLGEFLGLPWRREDSDRTDVRITLSGHPGEIRMPDCLLSVSEMDWLKPSSMPKLPLLAWNTSDLGLDANVIDPVLPVIYGNEPQVVCRDEHGIRLPVDVFGSAFFMLSRYEELVTPDRDEHDRFPAWASVAYKEGFLERPIVDEYVEVLWGAIQALWPGLQRQDRYFQMRVSHDVDRPSRYQFGGTRKFIRSWGGDIIKRGQWADSLRAPMIRAARKDQLHPADPYNTFEWIMDLSEQQGLVSAFYFICGRTCGQRDADYDIGHPAIRALLRRIHQRGHEIGLHPSYGTYKSPSLLKWEADRLRRICAEEGIKQQEWGGRMHYLRWETPVTMRGWEQAGMTYDSTLSYADRPGFRCGTCHEYPAFDSLEGKTLNLRIRPLIAMECTVMAEKYLGLGLTDEAREKFVTLKNSCEKVNGVFTMLWHNSELTTTEHKALYESVVAT
ncbi:MAG: MarR family transcriptional regulator [Desulfobulbaceae bacterium DB1]|nr:MAG: MarR family transcriptional regulator [Desulfobulbaceae bacterium DB1]